MKIGGVNLDTQVLIVAEIGNNHEGKFDVAMELVRRAAEAGAHAVKFQTFQTDYFVSRLETARHARLKSFELSYEQFAKLGELARSLGLAFISTPLDLVSAKFLAGIVDAVKIASGDNDFFPLLTLLAGTGKPVILSTGLADMDDVARAVECIEREWRAAGIDGELALLHCVTSYPVPPDQANVGAIRSMIERFDCVIGYSDHTNGLEAAVLSVAAGARIIEKHFTLDKNFSDFRDHKLSADPPELRELVDRVRAASVLLGDGVKRRRACEEENVVVARRSIVAARDLAKGQRLRLEDLLWMRPGGGLPPGQEHVLIGHTLRRDVRQGERLAMDDVAPDGD